MSVALETFSQKFDASALPCVDVESLYVHIPFCFHKCHYCDFYSITRQTPERMKNFVELILREVEKWSDRLKPRTIFFGGGTPTLLPLAASRTLIAGLRERLDFSQLDEFTVEANPATVSREYCDMLREVGVNRLSFGAQSFNRDELKFLERHHDPDDVQRSIQLARDAGFTRLNIDLIYAIPGQTLDAWAKTLDEAIALRTPHISCYALTYESNTPLTVRKRLGEFIETEESLELEMMRHTRTRLAQEKLHAYEISNFAIAGEECRHNLVYWTGGDYVGLGPSAASHVAGTRWKNRPHLGEWETAVARGDVPAVDVEHLTPRQRAGELAMLLLRLSRGLNFADYSARTGFNARDVYADEIDRLAKHRLIDVQDTGFSLSERGLPLADAIAAEFLDVPA